MQLNCIYLSLCIPDFGIFFIQRNADGNNNKSLSFTAEIIFRKDKFQNKSGVT